MRNTSLSSTILLLSLAAAVPGFSANIVANPGFETGDLSSWSVSGANSTPAENRTYYGVDGLNVHSGSYSGYFGGFGGVMNLTQTLTTSPGATYSISFWLAQLATPFPYVNSFSIAFGGTTLLSQTALPASSFTRYLFTGIASATTTDLTFGFRNDNYFFSLDDVSVEQASTAAAPEPGTFLLFSGALATGFLVKRRKSKSH